MKIYNKLIRDKIPEIIEKDGGQLKIKILEDVEYKTELLKKLGEESREALEANEDTKELIKEITDVLEVTDAIITAFNFNQSEIQKIKEERKNSRGGFDKKIFLEWTD